MQTEKVTEFNSNHKGNSYFLNRREFIRSSSISLVAASIGMGGLSFLSGCSNSTDWQPVSFPKMVFHNFNLFDGVSNRLQQGLVLVVHKDRIQGIERKGDLSVYQGYEIVDLDGATILPGLIDNHVHITVPFMYKVNFNTIKQMNGQILKNFRNCIFNGVTTVRDVGGFPGKINKYRKMADSNEIPGPRVISSLSPIAAREGDYLGAPEKAPYFKNPLIKLALGGNYAERPVGVKEIEKACFEMLDLGAQWLKTLHQDHPYSYSTRKLPNHTDEGYRKIIEIGQKNGIRSALHEPLLSGFKKGVNLGFHTLEHMPMDSVIPDHYVDKFMKQDMAMMPTIMIYGDNFKKKEIRNLIDKSGEQYLMPEAIKQMSTRINYRSTNQGKPLSKEEYDKLQFDPKYNHDMFPNVMVNLKKLHEMGATVGAGSDIGGTATGFFGRFTDELRHYAEVGISNFEILKMATSSNARIIGMQDSIGTLKKGSTADIIAVNGNPLERLDALDDIKIVMKGGVIIKNNGVNLGSV